MKTKLILGGIVLFAGIIKSQTWGGSASQTGNAYRTGNTGIGTTAPTYKLDISTAVAEDGIRVTQTNAGGAGLHLYNTGTGGHNWSLFSLNNSNTPSGGHFLIYDNTNSSYRLFIHANTGNVGIGTNGPTEKLGVNTSVSNDGIAVTQSGSGASALHMYNNTTGGNHWALFSTGNGNSQGSGNFSIFQFGGGDRLFIKGSSGNVGIGTNLPISRLHAIETSTSNVSAGLFEMSVTNTGAGSNQGVIGIANNAFANFGGRFLSGLSSQGSIQSIGVYAAAPIGVNDYAGYFNGNVYRTGTDNFTSDRKLKNNIKPLEDALSKLMQLKPSTYTFKTEEYKTMSLPKGNQMGLIAQDLEMVLPELVTEMLELNEVDKDGNKTIIIPQHKSVKYISLIPIIIGGIQEQQTTIETQQKQLNEQKQLIDACFAKNDSLIAVLY